MASSSWPGNPAFPNLGGRYVAFVMSVFLPGFPTNWRREDGLVVSLLAWKSGGRWIESTYMRRYSTYLPTRMGTVPVPLLICLLPMVPYQF